MNTSIRFDRSVWCRMPLFLAFLLFVLLNPLALAASPAQPKSQALAEEGKVFAHVWRIRGEVQATDARGMVRPLREGSPVHVGDRVRAAGSGEAVLKALDMGIIAIRPGAEFKAEQFVSESKASDSQVLRIFSGSLRLISGWIGKLNPSGNKVVTPTATIGIRGTDHEPYVLGQEQAREKSSKPGTYDKVNSGGTTLSANGADLDIDPGRVGFVEDGRRKRALLTLLLPVLLDKVPDFYVPGVFDAEIERYAEKNLPRPALSKPAMAEAKTTSPAAPVPVVAEQVAADSCVPDEIARIWLARFDAAIVRRDAPAVVELFAPEAVAKATVRSGSGMTTMEFNREEMVKSTFASLSSLKEYAQRRITVEGRLPADETVQECRRLEVKSVLVESGILSGKPFRFEATEEYRLERRDGRWLAVGLETTQR